MEKRERTQINASTDVKNVQRKGFRKRKRHIYNSIREQMEFYFSDSNLQKDRFMKQLIEKDPYVPLEVFLTFNNIKRLTDSVDKIAMAISSSELLELDETKKNVRRKTTLNPDENVDDRTLYVEALPVNVDHEWLISTFKKYGKVTYISLPKYAKTREPKDFGFVEFQTTKSVQKALKAFRNFNGVLCAETMDPAKLASIKAHNAGSKSVENEKKTSKRPLSTLENFKKKKAKMEDSDITSDEENSLEESSSYSANENNEDKKENSVKVKKRRRKRKTKELTAASFYELKVLPKRQWKVLRNRYLNLQRRKALNCKAARESQPQLAKENAAANSTLKVVHAPTSAKRSKREERRMHKKKVNFNDAKPPMKQALSKNLKTNTSLKVSDDFGHGVIVKVSFDKPCADIKDFKAKMRQHKTVKYVDVVEGAMTAFVRFETSTAAKNFIKSTKVAKQKYSVLKGKAETAYFEKIKSDRKMKLNKEIKVPSKCQRENLKAS